MFIVLCFIKITSLAYNKNNISGLKKLFFPIFYLFQIKLILDFVNVLPIFLNPFTMNILKKSKPNIFNSIRPDSVTPICSYMLKYLFSKVFLRTS